MAKVKLALLGCGDVAQRDYLPEFHRLSQEASLVAVCGKREARATQVAKTYDIPAVYTDYAEMLADETIEAVINLTPKQLHLETSLAVLRAGKHLYSEKPLGVTVEEAKRLQTEAEARNLIIISAPCVLLFPQVRYVKSLLEKGELGTIYSARAHGHGGVPPWHGYPSNPSQFFSEGGGPVRDMGVYALHALTGLLGSVRRVAAMSSRTQTSFTVLDGPVEGKEVKIGVDDNWHITLDFGNACIASLEASNCVQATKSPQLELYGHKGSVALDLLDVSATIEVFTEGTWNQVQLPLSGRQKGPDHHLGVEHLVHCIQGETPVLTSQHALHVIDVIDQAAVSVKNGCRQDVSVRL